jgi:predicted nucleic acid-binding protein
VKTWIAAPPRWLEIHDTFRLDQVSGLDEGETAAIILAESLHADLLLIDERRGYRVAKERGLRGTGTFGVLDLAATRGLLDFKQAIERLRSTTFRSPEAMLAALLEKHSGGDTG